MFFKALDTFGGLRFSEELSLILLQTLTLFTVDAVKDLDAEVGGKTQKYIHIRIQQRNGRKTLTTVQGIPTEFDLKRMLKAFKKV